MIRPTASEVPEEIPHELAERTRERMNRRTSILLANKAG